MSLRPRRTLKLVKTNGKESGKQFAGKYISIPCPEILKNLQILSYLCECLNISKKRPEKMLIYEDVGTPEKVYTLCDNLVVK